MPANIRNEYSIIARTPLWTADDDTVAIQIYSFSQEVSLNIISTMFSLGIRSHMIIWITLDSYSLITMQLYMWKKFQKVNFIERDIEMDTYHLTFLHELALH